MSQLQSRWYVTLVVAGRSIGAFQTFSGGNVTATSVTTRPPGAEYPRVLSGEKQIEEITIGRDYDRAVDTDELMTYLRSRMEENQASVSRKPLDENRNPAGKGRIWVGRITAINEPDSDTNSDGDKSQFTITIQPALVA